MISRDVHDVMHRDIALQLNCGRIDHSAAAFERDVFSNWRASAPAMVAASRADFDQLIGAAEDLLGKGRYAEAAAAVQVAANYAVLWHTGQFASPKLERALHHIAQARLRAGGRTRVAAERPGNMKVLHVATELYGIGGHARMAAHWMGSDPDNTHSLVLTGQNHRLADDVANAVAASNGAVTKLNLRPGSLLQRARRLQALMASADLVVLHAHSMDIIPFLALAGLGNRPPSLLVNHSDHQFWVGSSVVDLVVSSRQSGRQLTVARRGVPPERAIFLPLCLVPRERIFRRQDARHTLGLPHDAVVVVSIARAVKFRDVGGSNFVETLVPALRADPRLHLVVVGPGPVAAWQDSLARLPPGRVRLLPETSDTGIFVDAADIYLDSFPFASITSLLEAGLRGLPLVTRAAFGPQCAVMEADSIGFDEVIERTTSRDDLCATIIRLAGDASAREALGAQTRARILATNVGDGWRRELGRVYAQAMETPQHPGDLTPIGGMSDLDLFIPFVFDDMSFAAMPSTRMAWATELALKTAPAGWRIRRTFELIRAGKLRGSPFRTVIPAWIGAQARTALRIEVQ